MLGLGTIPQVGGVGSDRDAALTVGSGGPFRCDEAERSAATKRANSKANAITVLAFISDAPFSVCDLPRSSAVGEAKSGVSGAKSWIL